MSAIHGWVRTNSAYRAVVRGWPEQGLLACSGGVDSSALLALAGIGVTRGEIAHFVVVHVDHLTRPAGAEEGVAVERLAARFGLRAVRKTVDWSDSTRDGSSPEERLRDLRYAALARVAAEIGATAVVTAHTRDDQIETILMRLLSGSGGLATSGMRSVTELETTAGKIVIHRPLLGIDRERLMEVLTRVAITPLVDPSNADRMYRRNALRADVIPALRDAFPGYEAALLRSTRLASRDADALDGIAQVSSEANATRTENETRVGRSVVRDEHPAIATRIIRWAAGRLIATDQRELTYERVESVRVAAGGRSGAVIELPYGIVARIERDEIVFERRNR